MIELSEKEILKTVGEINHWDRDAWVRKTLRYYDFITQAIPKDLKGKSVLDIGTLDGYFSFLAEKRGANRILATDIIEEEGFHLAKERLKSKVSYKIMDVNDLDKLDEKFDVVLFLGVLYHLRYPLLVLEKIYPKVKNLLVIESLASKDEKPTLIYGYKQNVSYYVLPSINWITKACKNVGFKKVEVVRSASLRKSRLPPIRRFMTALEGWPIARVKKGVIDYLKGHGRVLMKAYP